MEWISNPKALHTPSIYAIFDLCEPSKDYSQIGLQWGNWETHILNKVADNGIVEIFNVCPLDSL